MKICLLNLEIISVIHNGKLNSNYNEDEVSEYMKNDSIDINVDISRWIKKVLKFIQWI